MASAEEPRGRARLRRDSQQWAFDRFVNETGRVFHWQQKGRGRLPEAVKMHAMISKHLGREGERLEKLAQAEAAAGHDITALEFYFDAANAYANAQHPVFALNAEKRYLHGASIRCYDEVRKRSPYPIEHVDIPWEGTTVSGNLHLVPGDEPRPLIFFIPGCDMTKEMVPHPLYNFAIQRGLHLFVFDGPGQGESNLRGIKLTPTNYEEAASAALTQLLERPDVDADRVGLYSLSFGSYWGARVAATDHRYKAAGIIWASIADKYYLFEEESPRYKQLFAFLTQAESEQELDAFIATMGLEDMMGQIECPTLVTVGQYDPRSPVEEVYQLFDRMQAPAELWVFEDQHHNTNLKANFGTQWLGDHHGMTMDWLADRLNGKPVPAPGATKWLAPKGVSPNDASAPQRREWFGGN
jgi:dienelactone hydrolase